MDGTPSLSLVALFAQDIHLASRLIKSYVDLVRLDLAANGLSHLLSSLTGTILLRVSR